MHPKWYMADCGISPIVEDQKEACYRCIALQKVEISIQEVVLISVRNKE